jgi:hypothetical protein
MVKNTPHLVQGFTHATHIFGEGQLMKLLLLATKIPGVFGAGRPSNPNLNFIFAILHLEPPPQPAWYFASFSRL